MSFDGGEHQVVAVAGTSVRLRAQAGTEQVVLASFLMAAPDFAVVDGTTLPGVEPFGLLDGLPEEVLVEARDWERHVVEVESGLPLGAEPGAAARPEYDPVARTVVQRTEAKAAELGVGYRTVERMRARYAQQGLWGLVDRRAVRVREVTGRADARLVAVARQVIDAETHVSTGTRGRLIRQVVKAVEDAYGPGVVPLPGRSTFYKLIDALSTGRHTFGSAVTRRQTANRPQGVFTPTFAGRPGEQVQIDSTPIDVMVLLESGMPVRADLTIAVDVATRTICAAVLRPVGTKAVDAALLLARMLVPEPMRPGWSAVLRMSASRLPHARLVDVDARMELAAAKPVIVPDTIVIDGGRVFVSETFTRACARLGISVQNCRPGTPTDKGIVEATFDAINTLFCQHVAAYTGSNTTLRGDRVDAQAAWTVPDLQDLLDEWLLCGWQARPHDALRDPYFPRRAISPNDKYAALVAAAGYLPLVLTGEDYLELLPVAWRQINDYGVRIDYRTYDSPELGTWRRQHSGVTARRGLWEVHYDPYDLSQVFVRTPHGWVTAAWTHLPMVSAPFADFTWRHARRLAAQAGRDDTNETAVARVLDELLTRAQAGPPADKASARVAARTRVAAAAHRPPPVEESEAQADEDDELDGQTSTTVVPMGIFDARVEAERWPY
ncbi:Mu transposase C-terminal domain-containing protein [Plantactinospora sp. KLBMP9567]|uniref:Mu transposase C-terminal domain-containing protein n=1 Tax=Plantactinospora sp. KLBMP9567 TaxID=3085900 RepID=UPI002981F114|nr:Mu transposase C-terminal domain-containing protein [Plantactinospora sp. KLBMP9567]MDW5324463.1 Mu transposase C-terminal domain-containing protein [Plantactinospora sp. KLBMP9567]